MTTFADDLGAVGQPEESIQDRLARVRAEAAARRRALEQSDGRRGRSFSDVIQTTPATASSGNIAQEWANRILSAFSTSPSVPAPGPREARGMGGTFYRPDSAFGGQGAAGGGQGGSGGGGQPSANLNSNKPKAAPRVKPKAAPDMAAVDGGMELEPLFGKTLADYLAEADASQFSAGALSDIEARESALRNQASASDALMQQAYAAVVRGMQAQDPAIQARYDQARTNTDAATQRAVDLANSAVTGSMDNINQTAQNLGITEALPGATGGGNGPGGVNANLVAQLAGYGQLSGQSLIDSAANQRTFNADIGSATDVAGAENRAQLQRDLMAYLAQLQDERTQVNSAAQSQALDLARALYEADYGQARDQREYEAGIDGAAYDTALAQAKLVNDTKRADAALLSAQGRSQQQAKGIMGISDSLIQRGIPANTVQGGLAIIAKVPRNNDPVTYRTNVVNELEKNGVDPKYIPFLAMAAEEFYQQYRS